MHICPHFWVFLGVNMKHHKYHQHYQVKAAKIHAQADAAYDIALAIIIGVALAAVLVYGWTL